MGHKGSRTLFLALVAATCAGAAVTRASAALAAGDAGASSLAAPPSTPPRAWKPLRSASASATSFLQNNWNRFEENYHPSYVLDENPATAWVEGAAGHVMSGAHDVELLRGALAVAVSDGALTVTSVGVGHSFPTGDVFRHLTIEVREDGGAPGAWRVVARLGRRFDTRLDGETLLARKVETADTSLRPGEARVIRLPAAAKSWRVRYHYGSERDERRGLVPDSALFATLTEGDTRQR